VNPIASKHWQPYAALDSAQTFVLSLMAAARQPGLVPVPRSRSQLHCGLQRALRRSVQYCPPTAFGHERTAESTASSVLKHVFRHCSAMAGFV